MPGIASLLILLGAVDEGLGACFFGIPPERFEAYRAAFDVPGSSGRSARVRRIPGTTTAVPRRCPAVGAPWTRWCTVAGGDGRAVLVNGGLARDRPGDRAGLRRAGRPGRRALGQLAGPGPSRCWPSCPGPVTCWRGRTWPTPTRWAAMVDRGRRRAGRASTSWSTTPGCSGRTRP